MFGWRRALWILVAAVTTIMVSPVAAAAPSLAPASAPLSAHLTTGATAAAPLAGNSHAQSVLSSIRAAHVPMRDAFLPNFAARPSISGGHVSPGYISSPAPMGLGDWGVQKSGGHNVGVISYTMSDLGVATFNSVDPFYLASTSPDWFTVQLNTVLNHVDVMGNSSGVYWIQNVPVYQASTQTLSIEDNIWNFSSPTAGMLKTTLWSYDGTIVAPTFYFAVGPAWHMPAPFTVDLYNNASVVNDRPTVFFNYSITAANGTVYAGSYDQVEFNSTGSVPPTSPAPTPVFQINGKQLNPLGLLNDEEIMIGGPGGGSTTTLLGINASMALYTLPNGSSTYKAAPAAYSYGTDTGETSEGVSVWTTGPGVAVAQLSEGPSLLQPLWGIVGSQSGASTVTVSVTPSNAFVFASSGSTFRVSTAAWAPLGPSGTATYVMAAGTYTWRFLLSDYTPVTVTSSGSSTGITINLPRNTNMGLYTPLWAWDNAQLASISSGGAGTLMNPYVLETNSIGPVSPLFGEFNDFYFPVFTGIFLGNTNAHVTATDSGFAISYSLPAEAHESAFFGTPLSNNLGIQVYNASHVAIVGSPLITGWFFLDDSFEASVFLWGATDSLVAGNNFGVQSVGISSALGGHNTFFGNVFRSATTTALNPGAILDGANQIGMLLYESNDLTYSNGFLTPITAATPPFNLYSGAPQIFTDGWSVHLQNASTVHWKDGFALSGNVLGLSTNGGNYWANYGTQMDPYGQLPYNNGGFITVGGDWAPLVPFALDKTVFTEHGLTAGTLWSVTFNGITKESMTSSIVFWDPAGTYAFTIGTVTGFTANPSSGAITVSGTGAQAITFS